MKKLKVIGKVLCGLIVTILGALLIWFIASYIDIVLHNLTTCEYASWNLIQMIFN